MEITFENYTKLKSQNLKRAEIAELFKIPDWKLKKLISVNKWGKQPSRIENETAFDEYSEEACYWAGFLAADGNVDQKGRVRIMLKYDDYSHLEKFKEFLQSTHTISSNTTKYNRCSFEFTSRYICDILDINFNIVPNKTAIYTLPSIPNKYFRHYVRGYFDGDGSICESFSNINSSTATLYTTFASGSKDFSVELFDKLNTILLINGHLQEFKDSNKYQIKYTTNNSRALLSWMYKDAEVYLDRKYILYSRIVVGNNRLMRDKGIVQSH